jgi:hypothetical protein
MQSISRTDGRLAACSNPEHWQSASTEHRQSTDADYLLCRCSALVCPSNAEQRQSADEEHRQSANAEHWQSADAEHQQNAADAEHRHSANAEYQQW